MGRYQETLPWEEKAEEEKKEDLRFVGSRTFNIEFDSRLSGTLFEYYISFEDAGGEVGGWRETEYVKVL